MATAFKKMLKKQRDDDEHTNKRFKKSDSDSEAEIAEKSAATEEKAEKVEEQVSSADEEEVSTKPAPGDELFAFKDPEPHTKEWKNRQRTLVVCSRGIAGRMRHLVTDLMNHMPNTKKESKIDRKKAKETISDLCFDLSCNNLLFFEQHKHKDLFMWLCKSPNGPSAKFLVSNIHTTEELKLTGNCLKFSRPLLSFDGAFEQSAHLRLTKEMLVSVFNTPKNHPKSKPFIDHVLSFKVHDGRIWFRAFQIMNQHEEKFTEKDDIEKLVLIEIGPRMTLQPIKIFDDTLGGEALWQNGAFITPQRMRSKDFGEYIKKRDVKADRKNRKTQLIKDGQDEDRYLDEAFQ